MKFLPLLLLSLLCSFARAQESEIIRRTFSDTANFDLTTRLDNHRPKTYVVLSTTDRWNRYRFHLDDNLASDSVRRALAADEHSPYNNLYIFRDTALDRLFGAREKEYLYRTSQTLTPRRLKNGGGAFTPVPSFAAAREGFLFSVTDPLFTADRQYAFLNITIYKKDAETPTADDAVYGLVLLIYHYTPGRGWTRIKKINHLVL